MEQTEMQQNSQGFDQPQPPDQAAIVARMNLPGQTFAGWRRVGRAENLKTDADIATFLVHLYEKSQTGPASNVQCVRCHNTLILYCTNCQLPCSSQSACSVEATESITDSSDNRMAITGRDMLEYLSDSENSVPPFEMDATAMAKTRNALSHIRLSEISSEEQAIEIDAVNLEKENALIIKEQHFTADHHSQPEVKEEIARPSEIKNSQKQAISSDAKDIPSQLTSSEQCGIPEASRNYRVNSQKQHLISQNPLSHAAPPILASGGCSKAKQVNGKQSSTGEVNPLMLTTPSMQLRGGWCEHKRVKDIQHEQTANQCENEVNTDEAYSQSVAIKAQNKIDKDQTEGDVSKTASSVKKVFPCKHTGCSRKYSSRGELRKHMKFHTDPEPFRCRECAKRFAVKIEFHEHLRSHYKCEECGVSWVYKRSIRRHYERKHKNGGAVSQCPDCGLTFTHKNAYRHHMRLKHPKEHRCEECSKTFPDYLELRRHLEEHYRCEECRVSFTCKSSMKAHMTLKHKAPETKQSVTVCHICGKSVSDKYHQIHMRYHTGAKPYQCDVCHKSFSAKNLLSRHSLIHTGERPFKCHLCPASYKDHGGLRSHLITHGGNKPFHCANCPKSYATSSELKTHMRLHTGETPFECPTCHMKFRTASARDSHVQRKYKTGETPCLGPVYKPREFSERHRFACPVCGKRFTTASHLKQHRNRRNRHGMPCFQGPS